MVNSKISTTYGTKSIVTIIPGQTDLNDLVKTFTDIVFPGTTQFIVSLKSEELDVVRQVDLTKKNNYTFPDATYFNITICESIN